MQKVNAADYNAYWLWAGVKPQGVLDKAKTVYILDGEIRGSTVPQIISLRPALPRVDHADLWLVIRMETLDWTPETYSQILSRLSRWSAAGNRVTGLQIDFDARTRGLHDYAVFLKDLRHRLPPQYRLGITGLLDWSANGDPAGLQALSGIVDEIVLQTYQGRKTIPGYPLYLAKLDRLDMPYRIGLVQGGEWQEPETLQSDPDFQGYVVFLVNPV